MGLLQGRASRADERRAPLPMSALLGATLRSPRELTGMLVVVVVAVVLVSPLPPLAQPLVGILLAAVPGTILLNRVRRRLERDQGSEPES
jgi:hypothetical protein